MKKAFNLISLIIVIMSATAVFAVSSNLLASNCDSKLTNCLGKFFVTGTNEYEYVVTTDIQPGWNIVSLVAYDELMYQFSKEGNQNLIKVAYLYNPETKEYYSLAEFDKGFSSKEREAAAKIFLDKYDEDGLNPLAVWVYIDQGSYDHFVNFKLKFGQNRINDDKFKSFPLIKGWNFMTLIPDLTITEDGTKSRPLNDFFLSCNVQDAFIYDAGSKKWVSVMDNQGINIFRDGIGDASGVAIIIKVANNCDINPFNTTQNMAPPSLPGN